MGKKVHKIYKNPDWINWVGCEIVKHSNKPFKSGNKVGVVKELTTNPHSNKTAFLMDDGSIVDCYQCKLAPMHFDIETGGLGIGELPIFYAPSGQGKSQFIRETPSIEDINKMVQENQVAQHEDIEIVDYMNLLDPSKANEVTESGRGHLRKISEIMAEFIADLKRKGKQTMIVPKGIGKYKEK